MPVVRAELRGELKDEVLECLRVELRDTLEKSMRGEMKDEIRDTMREEMRDELHTDMQHERTEMQQQMKVDLHEGVVLELRREHFKDIAAEPKPKNRRKSGVTPQAGGRTFSRNGRRR